MCGRYTLNQSGETLAQTFSVSDPPPVEPRFNIAPTQPVLAVVEGQMANREFRYLQWGLVPSWAKDPKMGARMINARAETVAEKPSFRAAFKRRRCLIPADGFYEWKRSGKTKQPFYFYLTAHQPFAFAGLWEHWEHGDGSVIESCTILTTEANDVLKSVHDRMPVILATEAYSTWLDANQSPDALFPLLRPFDPEAMSCHAVSVQVNSPAVDAPDCIAPIEAA